ncbi:MAG TPA: DinB family protein [Longimicrobium sp.]|nr:DinB family protein [Longimicrobium sp.]
MTQTTETARIADQLARAFEGDPWWGPATADVLAGLTPEQAARRPLPQAHTPWEIVLHMTAWNREVLRRLRTGVAREPEDGDWPEVPDPTPENWTFAVRSLASSVRELRDAVDAFPPGRLAEVVGDARDRPLGSGVSYYVLLHGAAQHLVAHTAQMSLLKKALET